MHVLEQQRVFQENIEAEAKNLGAYFDYFIISSNNSNSISISNI